MIRSTLSRLRQPSQGFTLIESLVGIVIVGVLSAIAAPNFLNWYNNRKIDEVLAEVEGAIKIVQSSAVKNNTTCRVTIEPQQVTANPSQCLPTGVRLIDGTNANLATERAGSNEIVFTAKGSATIVADQSVIVIFDQDAPSSRQMRCIVVSSGVGLIRTGDYVAETPPMPSDDPAVVESSCVTSL